MMLKHLQRLDDLAARVEKALVVFVFSTLIVCILFNIVSRNLFDSSHQIILEISPALVLWLALLGSTLALKYNRHIRLELILRFVPASVRRAAGCATGLFGLAVMVILCLASLVFLKNEIALFGLRGGMSVIMPAFFALAAFRFLLQFIEQLPGTDRSS